MPNATVRASATALPEATKPEATKPEATPQDEYLHALAAKCMAEARYEEVVKKGKAEADAKKAEADAKAEEPKLRASREFSEAYHAWLVAKADDENPSVEDEGWSARGADRRSSKLQGVFAAIRSNEKPPQS